MSSTPSSVYQGFWINWVYGRTHGSTLTLSLENSAFLIAIIALFVRFVGGQLWSVLTFLTSITRSTTEPQDALYHQQQAILRNTSQPQSVAWAMLKLSWFWKGSAKKANVRALVFVFSSLAYIAAFAVAGIFSSKISSINSEVLLLPTQPCGVWPYPWYKNYDPATESIQDFMTKRTQYFSDVDQLMVNAHLYEQQCSNSTSSNKNGLCFPPGRSRITWSTDAQTPCPFQDDICVAEAVQFDTGFISSRTHFGINFKDDHIEYRRVMTCAPIKTDGYVSSWVNVTDLDALSYLDSEFFQDETFLTYNYGPNIDLFNTNETNATFAYSNLTFSTSFGTGAVTNLFIVE